MSFFGAGRFASTSIPVHDHQDDQSGGSVLSPDVIINSGPLTNGGQFELVRDAFSLTGISDAVSGNLNDYNPGGVAGEGWSVAVLSVTGARNLTGLDASIGGSGDATGCIVIILNIGTGTLTCKNASTSSAAANRFAIGADLAIGPNQAAAFYHWFDTSYRWRLAWGPSSSAAARSVIQASLAANVNDYAPGTWATAVPDALDLDPGGASRNITGFDATAAVDGTACDLSLSTGGASAIVLVHNSAASLAANRIFLSGVNRTVTIGCRLVYNSIQAGWKLTGFA